MRTYPLETSNPNVPSGSFLLSQWSEGECTYTAYVDKESGCFFKVGDWKGDNPTPISWHKVCQLTGDTLNMVTSRFNAFLLDSQR